MLSISFFLSGGFFMPQVFFLAEIFFFLPLPSLPVYLTVIESTQERCPEVSLQLTPLGLLRKAIIIVTYRRSQWELTFLKGVSLFFREIVKKKRYSVTWRLEKGQNSEAIV